MRMELLGAWNPRTVRVLRELIQRWKPRVVFLLETKLKKYHMEKEKFKTGLSNGLIIPSLGRSGGISYVME